MPGQYFDKESNTHYNYFRDFDPAIGRYIQSDPIGLRGGINTFLYVSADPLTGVDPFGWKTFKICGADNGIKLPDNFGPYSFTQACINHDACYDDCVKRSTKEECDRAFFTDTMNACNDIPFFFRVLGAGRECVDYAFKYSLAVERLGKKAFNEARRKCPPCPK